MHWLFPYCIMEMYFVELGSTCDRTIISSSIAHIHTWTHNRSPLITACPWAPYVRIYTYISQKPSNLLVLYVATRVHNIYRESI